MNKNGSNAFFDRRKRENKMNSNLSQWISVNQLYSCLYKKIPKTFLFNDLRWTKDAQVVLNGIYLQTYGRKVQLLNDDFENNLN